MKNKSKDPLKEQKEPNAENKPNETNTENEPKESTYIELAEQSFYLLEDKTDENGLQRWIFGDVKKAVKKLHKILKEKDIEKLNLISIDISGREWKISPASWGIVLSAIVKGDIPEPEAKGETPEAETKGGINPNADDAGK